MKTSSSSNGRPSLSTILLLMILAYHAYHSKLLRVALDFADSDPDLAHRDAIFGLFSRVLDAAGLNSDISWASKTDLKVIEAYREEFADATNSAAKFAGTPEQDACSRGLTCNEREVLIKAKSDGRSIRLHAVQRISNATKPQRMVIFFHPGGGVIGFPKSPTLFSYAPAMDAIVFSVEYRKAPEHPYPAAIDDGSEVLSWAFEHAAEFAQDPKLITIVGESAGSMVAAAVAQRWKDLGNSPRIHQLVLIVPMLGPVLSRSYVRYENIHFLPMRQMGFFWDMYAPNIYECVVDPICSPVSASVERLKGIANRVAIIPARSDVLFDEAKEYARKLKLAGVDVKFHPLRGTHIGVFLFQHEFRNGDLLRQSLA